MTVATQDTPTKSARRGVAEETGATSKHLSFRLGKEEYGLEILAVREIIGLIDITPLPQTPDYVKGVINLRGKIIPVIELRRKFGLESAAFTEETCVIVVEVADKNRGEQFQMGLIVDSVSEVLDIAQSMIEPAPSFGCDIPLDYIQGMGRVKDKVIVLLNIDNVMSTADVGAMRTVAAGDAAN